MQNMNLPVMPLNFQNSNYIIYITKALTISTFSVIIVIYLNHYIKQNH